MYDYKFDLWIVFPYLRRFECSGGYSNYTGPPGLWTFSGVMISQVGWPRERWNTSLTGRDCAEKHSWKITWAFILLKIISLLFKMLCRDGFDADTFRYTIRSDTWDKDDTVFFRFHFFLSPCLHTFPLLPHFKCRSLSLYSLTFSLSLCLLTSCPLHPLLHPFPSLLPSPPFSHPPGWCLQLNLANVTQYWLLLIFIMFVNMFFSSAINLPC